jgi:hypothetical protein
MREMQQANLAQSIRAATPCSAVFCPQAQAAQDFARTPVDMKSPTAFNRRIYERGVKKM